MAVTKAKKETNHALYAMNSTEDADLGLPVTLSEVKAQLDYWDFEDGEVVTVYKLVEYKKYIKGQSYVEVK